MRNANGLLEEDGFILRPGSRTIFGSFWCSTFLCSQTLMGPRMEGSDPHMEGSGGSIP